MKTSFMGGMERMNINLSFLLFSLIILLYWVITELFTFFFRLTELPENGPAFRCSRF